MDSCCREQCYAAIDVNFQISQKLFWEIGDYNSQNIMLCSLMKLKQKSPDSTVKRNYWIYYYFHPVYGIRTRVCQKFLCHVMNLDKSRLLTVQKKLLNGEPLHDKVEVTEIKN